MSFVYFSFPISFESLLLNTLKSQKKETPKRKKKLAPGAEVITADFIKDDPKPSNTDENLDQPHSSTIKNKAAQKGKHAKDVGAAKKKPTLDLKKKCPKRKLSFSSTSSESSVDVSSGESVWHESDQEEITEQKRQPVQKHVGEYVVFKYEGRYYPGKIIAISAVEATITAMKSCGRLWKWPDRPDILDYNWKSVIYHICEPQKTSKTRNVYSVPELEFLWNT